MSDVHISYAGANVATSPRSLPGQISYIQDHLASPQEAGPLATLTRYLGRDGRVKAQFHNPDLWRRVGATADEIRDGILAPDLVMHLMHGEDRQGNPLGRCPKDNGLRWPVELLITMPSEVSTALADLPPEFSVKVVEAMKDEALHQLEACATRVSRGGRHSKSRVRTAPADVLAISWIHGQERTGLPHVHPHILIFPAVRSKDNQWRRL